MNVFAAPARASARNLALPFSLSLLPFALSSSKRSAPPLARGNPERSASGHRCSSSLLIFGRLELVESDRVCPSLTLPRVAREGIRRKQHDPYLSLSSQEKSVSTGSTRTETKKKKNDASARCSDSFPRLRGKAR